MKDLTKLVRQNILDLDPYKSARDEYTGTAKVFLDANENPYGTLNRYPDPYQQQLKQLIAKTKKVSINQLFIGNGSDEIIDLLFRVFCNPGKDKAVVFTPSYGMYSISAAINQVELYKIPLSESFSIIPESIQPFTADDSVKLLFICSPNNPTGNCVSPDVLRSILGAFNGIVVVDEAYIDFCPEQSCINLLEEFPNLVITQTMSKAWGLASARIGIGMANKQIIALLNKVKPPYNVSGPNQQAAINALNKRDFFRSRIEKIIEQRRQLANELQTFDQVLEVYPSQANFLLVRFRNAQKIYEDLIREQVVVRNRNSLIEGCIRISIGSENENEKLLEALKKIEHEESIIY